MKRSAGLDTLLVEDSVADASVLDDVELLANLLEASYKATYKGSSLKVRRRYRKLLVALTTARLQRAQAAVYSAREHETVTLRSPFQR